MTRFNEYVPGKATDVFGRARICDTSSLAFSLPPSPHPNPQWFAVPSYNVSTEPHKIINRNGELVARFEDLDEAIRVAELWNREVGK